MDKLVLGLIGCLLCSSYVKAALTIKEIVGPEYVEDGSVDELVLDCDFQAEQEENIVVKWFINGEEEQIYQWITDYKKANAMGDLKDIIDATYKVTDNPNTMFRALKFTEVSPAISGNYTCKVSGDDSDATLTKQLIVYSPATSFEMVLIDGEFDGDEAILCNAFNVSPKPVFELYIDGYNDSSELSEEFVTTRHETVDKYGFYNISLMLPFNSSYLDEGTTRFICNITIPGTNYSEIKSVEHYIDNGVASLVSSLVTIIILTLSLLLTT
ncbi:uncharacterized protein LOC115891569 isoform X2 [Sitophilus oryzae]|uniref:Uncharacterized protein LOC115891569 isoform X2 n=1 Tax=Sitophilus oryzae TaxID=7048 RepID=A0A6J2YYL2_SITOR|nr:uncharacterized protein LOC115891569 isoform X2 [Sitophilus oryzae]